MHHQHTDKDEINLDNCMAEHQSENLYFREFRVKTHFGDYNICIGFMKCTHIYQLMLHQEENIKIPDNTKCLDSVENQFCEICDILHLYWMVHFLLDIKTMDIYYHTFIKQQNIHSKQ